MLYCGWGCDGLFSDRALNCGSGYVSRVGLCIAGRVMNWMVWPSGFSGCWAWCPLGFGVVVLVVSFGQMVGLVFLGNNCYVVYAALVALLPRPRYVCVVLWGPHGLLSPRRWTRLLLYCWLAAPVLYHTRVCPFGSCNYFFSIYF